MASIKLRRLTIRLAIFGVGLWILLHVRDISQIFNDDFDGYSGTCETPACIQAAKRIIENMDSRVNPCSDFYKFACGGFLKKTFIPDDRASVSPFDDLEVIVENQTRLLIPNGIKDDRPVFKSMNHYYEACMDIDQIENNSERELLEVLSELGGCPLLDGPPRNEWPSDFNPPIYDSIAKSLIQISVDFDPNNSNKHIMKIDRAEPRLYHRDLIQGKDSNNVKYHYLALIEIVGFLGVDAKNAEKELGDVIDFQTKLAKISLSDEDRKNRSKLNTRMTLGELNDNYLVIDWVEFIGYTIGSYVKLDSSEEIILVDESYFKSLYELLPTTPLRVLANYACVRQIWELRHTMGKRFLNTQVRPVNAEPRSQYCVEKLHNRFTTAVGWLYVKHYFDKSTKEKVVELVNYLRDALRSLINSADWMDDSSRLRTMDKLMNMKAYIGYPDEFDVDEKIDEVYENLPLLDSSFLRSELTLNEFDQQMIYLSLRKPVNETTWIARSDVAMINTYYSLNTNSFVLPVGILQGHFFSKDKPNYLNYGAIGSFIGHEMSHAFDEQGTQYDEKGNSFDCWKNVTRQKYLEKSKCFIGQYSQYHVKELNRKINGAKTKNENIADNVGLKAAYSAYRQWVKKNGKEPRLPNLNLTPKQMFWLSFANNWCGKYKWIYLSLLLQKYPTSEARVIGTLSNLQAFSDAFNCSVRSPMNPAKKCSVF